MALKFVSGIEVTNITLSSYLDLAKQELRNAQIHNLSTTQINAISSPVQGQVAYDTTIDVLKIYDGSAWQLVGAAADDTTIELSSNTLSIKDGGVSTAKIADDAVTAAKLADTAVTAGSYTAADITIDAQGRITAATSGTIATSEIAGSAVTTAKIAADAVTGAKIADNAIDSEHYTDGSIDTAHLANDSVTAAKLADTAVTAGSYTAADITIDAQGRITAASSGTIATAEIADDAVTNAKLAANSVDSDQYVDGSIDTAHIATDAVTAAKIADNSIDIARLNVTDGNNGEVLTTDGNGNLSFSAQNDDDVSKENLATKLALIDTDTTIGSGSSVDFTFSGDLSVTGDLVVSGTTTTVNSTTVTIDDPVFTLGGDTAPSSDDNKDRGIEFRYYDTAARLGFFGYDDSLRKFVAMVNVSNNSEVFDGDFAPAQFAEIKGTTINATSGFQINGSSIDATAAELNVLDGITATTSELNILDGVTATASEINILDGVTATTAELNIMDGVTATTAELNYVDGVTSNIQTQLNGKQATITGAATTIDDSNLTANRAVVSNGSGKIAVSAVTSTELGYLDGVTSAVQTQLNARAIHYVGTVAVSSGSGSVDFGTHGVRYPANVQIYDQSTGALVLADIVQSPSGENDITINAEDATYDIVIVGK